MAAAVAGPGSVRARGMALASSIGLHAALLLISAGTLAPLATQAPPITTAFEVEVAVPGNGPPGAPAGDAPAVDSPDDEAAVAPPPRARTAAPRSTAAPLATDERSTETVAPVETAPGSPDGDAFIDALLARSTGTGNGAGGRGGAGCPDPIAGTWRAQRWSRERQSWGVFTLRIEREGDALAGTIHLHSWSGPGDDPDPPTCMPGIYEHEVFMNASGVLERDQVRFEARDHDLRVLCMDDGSRYNDDRFTGTVRGDRIEAVNNDGGVEVNAPYSFRRIACR